MRAVTGTASADGRRAPRAARQPPALLARLGAAPVPWCSGDCARGLGEEAERGNMPPSCPRGPANAASMNVQLESCPLTAQVLPFRTRGALCLLAAALPGFSPPTHPAAPPSQSPERAGGSEAGSSFAPLCVFRKRTLFPPRAPRLTSDNDPSACEDARVNSRSRPSASGKRAALPFPAGSRGLGRKPQLTEQYGGGGGEQLVLLHVRAITRTNGNIWVGISHAQLEGKKN